MVSIRGPHVSILAGESGQFKSPKFFNILFFQLLLDCMVLEWEPCNPGYFLPCVFTSICQILRIRSHRSQCNQPKTRENIFLFFLPWPMIEPKTFQSWVFCLAIWAITSLRRHLLNLQLTCDVNTFSLI